MTVIEPDTDMSSNGSRSLLVTHEPQVLLRSKVVIVGDEAVGKTSLVQSFVQGVGNCPKQYMMTLGVEFSVKEVIITANAAVDLFLYTTGGQSIANQRAEVMTSSLWANAQYIVCVYDIGSRQSFQNCTRWIQHVRGSNSKTPTEKLPCLLVGNKLDLRNELGEKSRCEVTLEEAMSFAEEHGFKYFECSAFLGKNVDLLFHYIANDYYDNHKSVQKQQKTEISFPIS